MKYHLPNLDSLRKESRSFRKELHLATGKKLSLPETEKLIARCLGYRDVFEHQKEFSKAPNKPYSLMEWREMDRRFVERLNKEFPGIGKLSLKCVQSALSMSQKSWQSNHPLKAVEMCLLIAPPECPRGPIGVILDDKIVVDDQLAFSYFMTLAGFNDQPTQYLINLLEELTSICQQRCVDLDMPEGLSRRQQALEMFHVLSKDMPVWQLKKRFRSLINHHRSLYFALDSLPINDTENSVNSHPESAPLLYSWRRQRVGEAPDWGNFIRVFEKAASSIDSDPTTIGISHTISLENEEELITSQGFLEGHTFSKKYLGLKDWKPRRFPVESDYWNENTCLIGCVGSGMSRSILNYLYPVLMRGEGALFVVTDSSLTMYWLLQAMMMSMGRPNDITLISSSFGHDDPWQTRSLSSLRELFSRVYESGVELEMANTLLDLLDRKVLLDSFQEDHKQVQVGITDLLTRKMAECPDRQKEHWKNLCVRFCHDQKICHQLWNEVLNQWVLNFSGHITSFVTSNPMAFGEPDIDWDNAVNQGKLVICLESSLEKDPGSLSPFIHKALDNYLESTKRLGSRGCLVSDTLSSGFTLSPSQITRLTEPDFTWVHRAREFAEVKELVSNSDSPATIFKRLVLHPSGNEGENLSKLLNLLSIAPTNGSDVLRSVFWSRGINKGPSGPGYFCLIDQGQVLDFRATYISFLGELSMYAKLSRLISA